MSKKNRDKRLGKKVSKITHTYTKKERKIKITNIMLELIASDMIHILTQDTKDEIQKYINTGETIELDIDLPIYSRILEIRLYNDKKLDTHFALKSIPTEVK